MTALIVQLPAFLTGLARHGTRLADGVFALPAPATDAPWPRLDHVALDLLAVDTELVLSASGADTDALAGHLAGTPVEVVAVSRGLRPVAAALADALHLRGHEVCCGAGRCVVVGRGRAWVATPVHRWQTDRFNRAAARRLREPDVSRAEVKWLQTEPLLGALGFDLSHVKHWLELGAAPGGMTSCLARRARVTALDRAPLCAAVAALDGVEAVVADALDWTPPPGVRYGGLVCDLNGPPRLALEAVARLAAWLEPGAPVVVTCKRPGWYQAARAPDGMAASVLAPAGIEIVRWQHLHAHRPAETVILARTLDERP